VPTRDAKRLGPTLRSRIVNRVVGQSEAELHITHRRPRGLALACAFAAAARSRSLRRTLAEGLVGAQYCLAGGPDDHGWAPGHDDAAVRCRVAELAALIADLHRGLTQPTTSGARRTSVAAECRGHEATSTDGSPLAAGPPTCRAGVSIDIELPRARKPRVYRSRDRN
jgi:hypothetical protein